MVCLCVYVSDTRGSFTQSSNCLQNSHKHSSSLQTDITKKARQTARVAAKKTEYLASNFDQKCGADTLLTMSEAAETAGSRPQPGIFQVSINTYSSEVTLCM